MKVFLTIFYAIFCIIFIGASHYYWTEKTIIEQASAQTKEKVVEKEIVAEKAKGKDNGKKKETVEEQGNFDSLISLTKNWPDKSVAKFEQALEAGTPFKIVIAGSSALGGETGWAVQTKAKLIEAFGSKTLSVEIMEFDKTSVDFILGGKHQELASLEGDMILFEPFILKNNGVLSITKTLEDLTMIMDTVKQSSPDTEFILQPTFPIYKAKNYPIQVAELKKFAEDRSISYLDHWSSWPSTETEEVKQYLEEDQNSPNQKGHQLWSDIVCEFLISNEEI